MTQIAVLVIHPAGTRSAHLVETSSTVAQETSNIVDALDLPPPLTWELVPSGSEKALPADSTLEICGVRPGAELRLRPVRDLALKEHLDQQYEDIERLVRDQQWETGKNQLAALLALDPTYPDPLGLEKAVEQKTAPARTAPRATIRPTQTAAQIGAASANQGTSSPIEVALVPDNSGKYGLTSKRPRRNRGWLGRIGCALAVVILFVVAVGGGMLLGSPDLWPALAQAMGLELPQPASSTLGTGDVQVTLQWSGQADLDLRVTGPDGDEIRFDSRRSESGGTLDVDANEGCEQLSESPVENVYWADATAPTGTYTVTVVYFQACAGSGVTDYQVAVTRNREDVSIFSGQIAPQDGSITAATFEYSGR